MKSYTQTMSDSMKSGVKHSGFKKPLSVREHAWHCVNPEARYDVMAGLYNGNLYTDNPTHTICRQIYVF